MKCLKCRKRTNQAEASRSKSLPYFFIELHGLLCVRLLRSTFFDSPRKWNGRLVDRMSGQKAGNIKRLDVAVATPLRLVQMLRENRSPLLFQVGEI